MAIPKKFHPSVLIKEEMRARRWSRDRLAHEMGGDFGITRLSLDFFFDVGPIETDLRMGEDMAAQFAKAFGVEAQFFLNLEQSWLDAARQASA